MRYRPLQNAGFKLFRIKARHAVAIGQRHRRHDLINGFGMLEDKCVAVIQRRNPFVDDALFDYFAEGRAASEQAFEEPLVVLEPSRHHSASFSIASARLHLIQIIA